MAYLTPGELGGLLASAAALLDWIVGKGAR